MGSISDIWFRVLLNSHFCSDVDLRAITAAHTVVLSVRLCSFNINRTGLQCQCSVSKVVERGFFFVLLCSVVRKRKTGEGSLTLQ